MAEIIDASEDFRIRFVQGLDDDSRKKLMDGLIVTRRLLEETLREFAKIASRNSAGNIYSLIWQRDGTRVPIPVDWYSLSFSNVYRIFIELK